MSLPLRVIDIYKECMVADSAPYPRNRGISDFMEALESVTELAYETDGKEIPKNCLLTVKAAREWIEKEIEAHIHDEDAEDGILFGAVTLASRIDLKWEPLYTALSELVDAEPVVSLP